MRKKRFWLACGLVVIIAAAAAAAVYWQRGDGSGKHALYAWENLPVPGGGFDTVLVDDPHHEGGLFAGGDIHGLKYSDSAGKLWELRDSGLWRAGNNGIAAIAPHPKIVDKVYMLSGMDNGKPTYGFYVSDDSGKTWKLLNKDLIPAKPQTSTGELRVYGRLIAIDASGPQDTLYVASYDKGLFKSTDGGKTFQVVGLAGSLGKNKEKPNLTSVVLSPRDPKQVFVGVRYDASGKDKPVAANTEAGGGIWMSPDGGATWKEVLSGVPVRDLTVDPGKPQEMYAACLDKGVYRSTDGGNTWAAVAGLPTKTKGSTAVYYNAVEVNPGRPGEVLVGTGHGQIENGYGTIYRSTDHGQTWDNLVGQGNVHPDPGLFIPDFYYMGGRGYAVSAIVIPWWDEHTIVVGGRSGVWSSPDDGDNWYSAFNGLQGIYAFEAAVQPKTSRVIAGVADFGILVSDPKQTKFTSLGIKKLLGSKRKYVGIAVDVQGNRIMAGVGNQLAGVGNYGTVLVTEDGEAWTPAEGLPDRRVSGVRMAPSHPDTAYAALRGTGIYKTVDGGKHWKNASKGLPVANTLFNDYKKVPLAVDPNNPDIAYVLDKDKGIFLTKDGGESWSAVGKDGLQLKGKADYADIALDPSHSNVLYLSTTQGLFRSDNGGGTWKALSIPGTHGIGALAVSPADGTVFAAAEADSASPADTQPGIYVSRDQGASWTAIYADGGFGVDINGLTVDPAHPDTLYVATRGSGLVKMHPARR